MYTIIYVTNTFTYLFSAKKCCLHGQNSYLLAFWYSSIMSIWKNWKKLWLLIWKYFLIMNFTSVFYTMLLYRRTHTCFCFLERKAKERDLLKESKKEWEMRILLISWKGWQRRERREKSGKDISGCETY